MAIRIYEVSEHLEGSPADVQKTTMVRARGKSAAIRHVSARTISAELATQDHLVAYLEQGGKVEEAAK